MEQIRLVLLILMIGGIFSGLVVFIAKFEKKSRLPKYTPAIMLFAAGAACLVKSRWFSEGMQGLGYIVLAMLVIGSAIFAVITAVVLDVLKKRIKKRV